MKKPLLMSLAAVAVVGVLLGGTAIAVPVAFGPVPTDLPTVPTHTAPPWVWHHDLVAAPGTPNAPLPAGSNFQTHFYDGLVGNFWHVELEILSPTAVLPAGTTLKVVFPDGAGGKNHVFYTLPAIGIGANFTIADHGGGGHDLPDIVWDESVVQETGGWIIRWQNNTGITLGVESSVAESEEPPFALTPLTPGGGPFPTDLVVEFIVPDPIPTMSEWGLIALAVALAGAGVFFVYRRQVRPTAA